MKSIGVIIPAVLSVLVSGSFPLRAQESVTRWYTANPDVKKAFTLRIDESTVPPYLLPDPLVMHDGRRVAGADEWWRTRRPEILSMFENEMYGKSPVFNNPLLRPRVEIVSEKRDALGGKAIRREVRLHFGEGAGSLALDILLYLPSGAKKAVPAYVMLNFRGNQSVTDEPDIVLCPSWMTPRSDGSVHEFQSTEQSRGVAKSRWPIEAIIDRGYALATACYQQISPDYDHGFQQGVHPLFYKTGQTAPAPNEWGALGAWSWGSSRILDYLESEPAVNPRQVVVAGHSRLGKAALWAGAQDQRFAVVIANNSGSGGGALSKRIFGETIGLLCYVRPHWFCRNFNYYADNEKALPFDQHELIALIAPRPVYIATAGDDWAADPKGEYLSLLHADDVYRLLGSEGLGSGPFAEKGLMPPLNHPTGESVGFHIRTGGHDVTRYDWEQFLNFTDRQFGR